MRRNEISRAVHTKGMTRVGIAVKARKRAARDHQPDPVPRQEDVARRAEVYAVLVRAVGLDEQLTVEPFTEARTQDALGQDDRFPIGMNVDELRDEVGVDGARRGMQLDGEIPGHLKRLL